MTPTRSEPPRKRTVGSAEFRNVRVLRFGRRLPWGTHTTRQGAAAERVALINHGIPAAQIETERRIVTASEWKRV